MEEENLIKRLVDKTIANHKLMIAAMKRIKSPPPFQNDLDKQRDYTESSMHRCRRCGDTCFSIFPSGELSLICNPCEKELRERDEPMWFVEILDKTRPKDKEKKNG